MTSRISVGRGILAWGAVAAVLGLAADRTFAQTVTWTPAYHERVAEPVVQQQSQPSPPDVSQATPQADQAGEAVAYVPPTGRDRLKWAVNGTVGAASIGTGLFIASWNTAWNLPSEWDRTWSGFGKRFGSREAQMTISNAIEAGLGAAWGEDPRYSRSGHSGLWARTGYSARMVFVARRRDGRLRPAWARYAGAVGSNVVANTWQPSGQTTAFDNVRRIGNGILGRFVGNLWMEFWPDVRKRHAKRD